LLAAIAVILLMNCQTNWSSQDVREFNQINSAHASRQSIIFRKDSMKNEDDSKPTDSTPPSPVLPKIISFKDLARCGDEIWIENNGSLYRLRCTKLGKLILTK